MNINKYLKNTKDKSIKINNLNNRLAQIDKWKKENEKAINEYNERIDKHGLFSDGIRSF